MIDKSVNLMLLNLSVDGTLKTKPVSLDFELFFSRSVCVPLLYAFIECLYADVKGKAILSQAWTSPEGSRRLRLPHFKTVGT